MGRTVLLGLVYRRAARGAVSRRLRAIVDRHDRVRAGQSGLGPERQSLIRSRRDRISTARVRFPHEQARTRSRVRSDRRRNVERIRKGAHRWFGIPKVVTGFLNFAVQPAVAGLLLPGIRWLAAAVPSFDSYDWRYGLEESLIAFLHTCWEREAHQISSDPSLQSGFLALLACVVSRGGHAAIALRDRVVNSSLG